MQRVLVIGSGGAGKTTVASRIGAMTGLPVIHLDSLYWRAGWDAMPEAEWQALVSTLVAQERWVIDGNYGGTLDMRLQRCDTVIFLDMPRHLNLLRVIRRWWRYRGRARPDMAADCPEQLTWEFVSWIWNYPRRRRPAILRQLSALPPDRKVIILRSALEVATFLSGLNMKSSTLSG